MSVSEIKFACPQCQQHITADPAYCGFHVACPACQAGLLVPRLAAFGFETSGALSLSIPLATAVPRSLGVRPLARDPLAWSAEAWQQNEREHGVDDWPMSRGGLLFLLLYLTPAFVGTLLCTPAFVRLTSSHGGLLTGVFLVVNVLCSSACGFSYARQITENVFGRWLSGLLMTFSMFIFNWLLVGFVGCLLPHAPGAGLGFREL